MKKRRKNKSERENGKKQIKKRKLDKNREKRKKVKITLKRENE